MITPPEIENYCVSHSSSPIELFTQLDQATQAFSSSSHHMQVGPLEGGFLSLLTRLTSATRVLEFGTFTGCSALHFALALPPDGRVTTLDRDARAVEIAKKFWAKAKVEQKIESILGDAKTTIKIIQEEILSGARKPYDLAFIDADKAGYEDYFNAALECLTPQGLILVDNLLWEGKVLNPEAPSDHALHRFNHARRTDSRVESLLLPIRDGLGVYRRRAPSVSF